MELYLETFDLSSMIDDIAATVDTLIKKKHNTLQIEKGDNLGSIFTIQIPAEAHAITGASTDQASEVPAGEAAAASKDCDWRERNGRT